jgi:hypothetical protein
MKKFHVCFYWFVFALTCWLGGIGYLIRCLAASKSPEGILPVINVQIVMPTSNTMILTWAGQTSIKYQVQWSTNLASANWTNLSEPILATNNSPMTVQDKVVSPQRFYRVIDLGLSLSGWVQDIQGPVSGAIVRVQGTKLETFTDSEGRFIINGLRRIEPITVSTWQNAYYCAFQEKVVPGTANIRINLRKYQTNDNPKYVWIPPVGENSCASCKGEVTQVWLDNDAHARSATNPRFLTMYRGSDVAGNQSPLTRYVYNRDYGMLPLRPDPNQPYYGPGYKLDFPNTAGNCGACHLPGVAVDAPYETVPKEEAGANAYGIHCDFCHKIADVVLDPKSNMPWPNRPGVLSFDVRRPFPEDPERYQLFFGTFDDDNVPAEDTNLPLIRQSRYCAPCHFGVFWNTTVYNSYGEWLASPYSNPAYSGARTCQQCHMPSPTLYQGKPITNVASGKGGIERDPTTIHAHTFPGAASEELLRKALTMTATAEQAPTGLVVNVSLTNDQTGHHVPSDSPLRHMILMVSATTTNGTALKQLDGPILPEWCGKGDPALQNYAGLPGKAYAKILEELWTEISPSGAYWNPTRVLSDNRLAAFATDATQFRFAIPEQADVKVEIKLLFRRAFKALMDQKRMKVPDIIMAEKAFKIQLKP